MAILTVRIQRQPFDMAAETAQLKKLPGVGAVVTFSGLCRDEGGRLAALELEHYPGMAEAEIAKIAEEAASRWPLIGATVIHRTGLIAVGDDIVLVATASAHRDAAFAAASFAMDYLKTRAPFWKKEHPAGAGSGDWIGAQESDNHSASRWPTPKT
ncbi:MAG TPA: molybdenum cofactor biosynthesis protein MoaE [Bauldia sp.]